MWVGKGERVWEELFSAKGANVTKIHYTKFPKSNKTLPKQNQKTTNSLTSLHFIFYVFSFPHLYISYLIFMKLLWLWIILTCFSAAAVFTPFSHKNSDSVCNPSSVSVATVGSLALTEKTVHSMSEVLDQWATGSQKLKGGRDWAHLGWALC